MLKNNITAQRKTSFEVLRIISMIMIIFHHFAVHWWFSFSNEFSIPRLRWNLIAIWWKIWVDVFVLISWYFLIQRTEKLFDLKKILKLYWQIFFYSISIFIVFFFLKESSINWTELIKAIFPISTSSWWFVSTYFVLFLIHPFLNKFLLGLKQQTYKNFIIFSLILFSLIPTFLPFFWWWWNLLWFMVLYALSWYIKLYWINVNITAKQYFYLFCICFILTYLTSFIFTLLSTKFNFFNLWITYFYGQDKISILLISLFLFMIFEKKDIKYNKYINLIASSTFWIYLIHDSSYVREFLRTTTFKNATFQNSITLIPYSIIVVFWVFMICSMIDLARKFLIEKYYMKFINKNENKISNKISQSFYKLKSYFTSQSETFK